MCLPFTKVIKVFKSVFQNILFFFVKSLGRHVMLFYTFHCVILHFNFIGI